MKPGKYPNNVSSKLIENCLPHPLRENTPKGGIINPINTITDATKYSKNFCTKFDMMMF